MRSIIRTYCLLVSLLFVACLYPKTGLNSAQAEVSNPIADTRIMYDTVKVNTSLDSLAFTKAQSMSQIIPDSVKTASTDTVALMVYKPDPKKAIWYSALCPGLGQLYNRRYWKLPIVGAAIVGIAYGIGWNQKYYKAYTNAYRDIADDDPNTKSYLNLLPNTVLNYDVSQLTTIIKNRQQIYRRSRDLSFIGAVGIYLVCLIDAYVDAQLYDFDVSPDLSLLPPSPNQHSGKIGGVELSLAFHF